MAHRAERKRRQAYREMADAQQRAEEYSQKLNWHWDTVLRDVFGLDLRELPLDVIDCTYFYDEVLRRGDR